ncbi:hypothetical protein CEP54_008879 [Fusarium duplospermum]|uniref:Uncharacterized protein n=1 Tax=Fusarium duplospermum TaxID=1325734 RepID=A0A428PTX0_9HYPO|nr:hypothetical protein CEP54_008879 [Fusarium duplospermum]
MANEETHTIQDFTATLSSAQGSRSGQNVTSLATSQTASFDMSTMTQNLNDFSAKSISSSLYVEKSHGKTENGKAVENEPAHTHSSSLEVSSTDFSAIGSQFGEDHN